jgi:hypothetical protein
MVQGGLVCSRGVGFRVAGLIARGVREGEEASGAGLLVGSCETLCLNTRTRLTRIDAQGNRVPLSGAFVGQEEVRRIRENVKIRWCLRRCA